jgi:hypothetical protein
MLAGTYSYHCDLRVNKAMVAQTVWSWDMSFRCVWLCSKVAFSFHGVTASSGPRPPLWGSWTTLRHNTLGRTSLDMYVYIYLYIFLFLLLCTIPFRGPPQGSQSGPSFAKTDTAYGNFFVLVKSRNFSSCVDMELESCWHLSRNITQRIQYQRTFVLFDTRKSIAFWRFPGLARLSF